MKVLFIVNPQSGKKELNSLNKVIITEASKLEIAYKIHILPSKILEEEVKETVYQYLPDIVACAGGDGTVNLLASVLANTTIPLLIIPCGSANGMAKELRIDNRIENAIGLIQAGKKKVIDLLLINNHICIHLADLGVNARIVKQFEKDNKRGLLSYAYYLFKELFLIRKHRFGIYCSGDYAKYKAISLTVANASKYGTGAVINPIGKLDDGKFELIIVKPFPYFQLFFIAWKMFRGNIQTSGYVKVMSCKEAYVSTYGKMTLQIDGQVIGKVRELHIKALPKALHVIVPSK